MTAPDKVAATADGLAVEVVEAAEANVQGDMTADRRRKEKNIAETMIEIAVHTEGRGDRRFVGIDATGKVTGMKIGDAAFHHLFPNDVLTDSKAACLLSSKVFGECSADG